MSDTPHTAAGRIAWAEADGLGPKLDTLTVTARHWRETILAIEDEAQAVPPSTGVLMRWKREQWGTL